MKPILTSLRATLVLAIITCGAYPLAITGLAHTFFKDKAHGSLITNEDGQIIGSALLSQNFAAENYFHSRPSAAGSGHDAASSGGSNLGPTSPKLIDALKECLAAYRTLNGLKADAKVPADAVTASASGLDPHISIANAELQATRVAKARQLSIEKVKELIAANTEKSFFGPHAVNVLRLNLTLDDVERVFQLVLHAMPPDFTIPEDFQCFNWRGDFWNYERNLPHWRQPGVTYFITFRLNDSLPREVVEEAKREKAAWDRRLAGQTAPDELLQEEYAAWQRRVWRKMESVMDQCHGSCVLRDPSIRQIVADALLFFEGERSSMHGFVIMPNHVHLAVRALGDYQIEEVLKSWKGFTSREINKILNLRGQLWQEDNWNRIIRDDTHWLKVMGYVANNPAKAHLRDGEFTTWFAKRTLAVERVFQPVLKEPSPPSPYPEDEPW